MNVIDISIGKLRQLVTLGRTGSFSKAAAELNISQPALSRSIAALETRYGFPIFNRLGHGVEPTAAGAQVIAQAEPLLQAMRVFDHNLQLFGSGHAGQLTVGFAPLLASQLLVRLADEFFSAETKAQLRVVIRTGSELLTALKDDAIELFFFPESYLDEPNAELNIKPVGGITPVCVVRRSHPLAGRSPLTLADLADFPWASSVDPPISQELYNPARFVCDNYHIMRDAVLRTNLVCICSKEFVAQQLADNSLVEIRVEDLPLTTTSIFMATLRGRTLSPLAQYLVHRVHHHLN